MNTLFVFSATKLHEVSHEGATKLHEVSHEGATKLHKVSHEGTTKLHKVSHEGATLQKIWFSILTLAYKVDSSEGHTHTVTREG